MSSSLPTDTCILTSAHVSSVALVACGMASTQTHVCMRGGQRAAPSVVLQVTSTMLSLRHCLSLAGTCQVGWAGHLVSPRDPPVCASPMLGSQVSSTTSGFLHVGSEPWMLQLRHHVYRAGSLIQASFIF